MTFASPQLTEFVGKLIRKGKRMGIPLCCESASFDVAFIVHSRRGRDLHPLEWKVIAHLGGEISLQYRLGVHWSGPLMPAVWLGTAGPSPF